MFVAQAHSFAQQARLAITLAWVAGYTNILTVLTCGTVTSHVSGTASNFGRDVAQGAWSLAGFAIYLLITFLFGAMISGCTTELGRRRGWDSIYVLPMIVEALLLATFAAGMQLHRQDQLQQGLTLYWMTGVASAAMGLQNATITHISSGVVRTTHVTGVLTDLGFEAVQFLWWLFDRRHDAPPASARAVARGAEFHPTARRLMLLASIVGSFAIGAGLGALAFDHATRRWSMFLPVLFLVWVIYQDLSRPIAEIETSDLIIGKVSDALAVFHIRKDRTRHGKIHRMPNLIAWADRLSPTIRVVILDLGEASQLDANAAMELRSALAHFAAQHRQLIITGLSGEQFSQLRRAGVSDLLRPENVCPDLELAVARGLTLLDHPAPSATVI